MSTKSTLHVDGHGAQETLNEFSELIQQNLD